jgi:hypothetical protein
MADVSESRDIARFLHERRVTARQADGSEVTLYVDPYPDRTRVTLYAIDDAAEQDRILRLLEQQRRFAGWKPIEVEFYDQLQFADRALEKLLRRVRIDR